VVHTVGGVLGILYLAFAPSDPTRYTGPLAQVELTANWTEPRNRAPLIEIARFHAEALVPVQQEREPLEVDVSQPETQLATAALPPAEPVAVRREIFDSRQQPAEAAASPTLERRETPLPSVANTKACQCSGEKKREAEPRPGVPTPDRPVSETLGAVVDRLPRKLQSNPHPPYPADAFARGQQGLVLLEVLVDEQGRTARVSIFRSSGVTSLDQSAMASVRGWRFDPARRAGRPVSTVVTVPIRFRVQSSGGSW